LRIADLEGEREGLWGKVTLTGDSSGWWLERDFDNRIMRRKYLKIGIEKDWFPTMSGWGVARLNKNIVIYLAWSMMPIVIDSRLRMFDLVCISERGLMLRVPNISGFFHGDFLPKFSDKGGMRGPKTQKMGCASHCSPPGPLNQRWCIVRPGNVMSLGNACLTAIGRRQMMWWLLLYQKLPQWS
jgi:hypothetical protein